MNKLQTKRFTNVLNETILHIKPRSKIDLDIVERFKRIVTEVEFCVHPTPGKEYLPLQQFRILMDKIINVIHLRDMGELYQEYLHAVDESDFLRKGRTFLSRERMNSERLIHREKFNRPRVENLIQHLNNHMEQKFYRLPPLDTGLHKAKFSLFEYQLGWISNDSSMVIHDCEMTYKQKNGKTTLLEIEQIVLFFVSNLFIPYCKDHKNKEYLKTIHKKCKNDLIQSKSLKKKQLKHYKKELRGAV
ncbi:hypothetical protein FAY30_22625 [Bacillus sp. S3]|uniref:hypothetical protein n=1 Tax=Bacillus sp. S3 TaxID=486398 RepID=UPI00118CA0C6|nr:hypothetical protein [Bacillus sp. S3]QCJ44482.1 hypothetical protein FAY30_22625 [Bacillus sp. S3]